MRLAILMFFILSGVAVGAQEVSRKSWKIEACQTPPGLVDDILNTEAARLAQQLRGVPGPVDEENAGNGGGGRDKGAFLYSGENSGNGGGGKDDPIKRSH